MSTLIVKSHSKRFLCQAAGPRREMLAALFADPATLEMTTDEELRPIVIEFIEAIVWLGGLESLRITLR